MPAHLFALSPLRASSANSYRNILAGCSLFSFSKKAGGGCERGGGGGGERERERKREGEGGGEGGRWERCWVGKGKWMLSVFLKGSLEKRGDEEKSGGR